MTRTTKNSKMNKEASYKELDLWIREELSQHGEWLVDRFVEALEKNRNVDTGTLIDEMDYRTHQGPGGSQQLEVTFPLYGRFAEVRSRRLKKQNGRAWAKKNHKPKKVEWYNRNRYAGYGRLIRRLTAGMSDAELQRIRGIIEYQAQKFAAANMH